MFKEIFTPSKRSFLIWIVILFISSPILIGIWQGHFILILNLLWGLIIVGSYLQAPFFLVSKLLPIPGTQVLENIITSIGILINSYIIASLISSLWGGYTKKIILKIDLILYLGLWILYMTGVFINILYSLEIYFLIFAVTLVAAIFITLRFRFKKYPKKVFVSICLLTLLFLTGALGQTLESFEEDYCWKVGQKADSSGVKVENGVGIAYKAHMDCHDSFNLINSLDDNSKLYSSKQTLCMDFAQSYLKTIQKTDNASSSENISSPENQRWEIAVDIETDFYNLCMLDLTKEELKKYKSTVIEKYQK